MECPVLVSTELHVEGLAVSGLQNAPNRSSLNRHGLARGICYILLVVQKNDLIVGFHCCSLVEESAGFEPAVPSKGSHFFSKEAQ